MNRLARADTDAPVGAADAASHLAALKDALHEIGEDPGA